MEQGITTNWLEKYASPENNKIIEARQAGGQAPAAPGGQQQQPPAEGAGAGAPNPQELLTAFGQAEEAGDQQTAMQIAYEFTSAVYQSMAQEQQASQAAVAARDGGKVPSFNASGKLE